MSRKFLFAFVASLVAAFGFVSGCSSDSSTGTPGSGTGSSGVMLIHASPDAPAADLYIDGTQVASSVSYLTNTNYLQLAPGKHRLDIRLPGMSTILYSDSGVTEANKSYSIFAAGLVVGGSFQFYGFEDTLVTPPSGNALVRFAHMSPDAPAVDVAVDGTVVIEGISFSEATQFVPYPQGTYTLQVRPAGSSTPLLTVPNVTVAGGKIYTFYARGLVSGTPPAGVSTIVNR